MNEQNILDAISDLVSVTEQLKTEVKNLKKSNKDLSGKLRLLNSNIENRL
ncbi:hypothetical protein [Hwangdonia seohaensis]|uniref:Cell division protein ZapB n=1 Tax=Hwangdonia seohaensis TaxID=1240727 RepID=A0ABW3RD30_9FLAO|nr:hypothetical protein [Hwangdonia seohaensis]